MGNDTSEMINSRLAELRIQNSQSDEIGSADESSYPYVIFQVFENKFAINCKYMVSIERVSRTTEIVNSSREVRGISYYKTEPISIFDLRKLFGLPSQGDYIHNIVNIPQRIKDHEVYAEALKDCIHSGKPFTLNIDPHKCAFGKWFYGYKGKVNPEVLNAMDKLEPYHNQFHKMAENVKLLIERGRMDEAAEYLDKIDPMKIDILDHLRTLNELMLKNTMELNIVLQLKNKKIGLIVDSAESVEDIDEIQDLPPSVALTKYIKKLGLSKKDRKIIFILEAKEFK